MQMELSQEEKRKKIESLINFLNINPDSREIKRAWAVKLALQGYVYRAIKNILNISEGLVSKWKKIFLKMGIEGLRVGYKGAPKKLKKYQEEETIKWVIMSRIVGHTPLLSLSEINKQ